LNINSEQFNLPFYRLINKQIIYKQKYLIMQGSNLQAQVIGDYQLIIHPKLG